MGCSLRTSIYGVYISKTRAKIRLYYTTVQIGSHHPLNPILQETKHPSKLNKIT